MNHNKSLKIVVRTETQNKPHDLQCSELHL